MFKTVYLDNNSTTPVHPEVAEAMLPFLKGNYGNPSSIHLLGRKAKAHVEEAREKVAAFIGAQPNEIIFCSGGTESDNMALKGAIWHHPPNCNWAIVTTAIEHSAVLKTVDNLSMFGYESKIVYVDWYGKVHPADVEMVLSDRTSIVSIMHSNNEVGTLQPVADIAKLAKHRGILMHTDAVQSAGKVPLNVGDLGVDLLSISAHKLYGPKGVGALFVRSGVKLSPVITGGSHERGMRAGTENVPGIIGFGKACEIVSGKMAVDSARISGMRDELQKGVLRLIPSAKINGHLNDRLPNTLNVCLVPNGAEAIMILCDMAGIAVSAGSACASGSIEPSSVLLAMGVSKDEAMGSIRISLGGENTQEDINYFLEQLPEIFQKVTLPKM
jgi:cysteine desulfurase